MGFFDWLKGTKSEPALPAGRFAPLPEDAFIRVVGESHYQSALVTARALSTKVVDGRPSVPVVLVPEPENPHDANAVAVVAATGRLGYLPRETAARFAMTMDLLLAQGFAGGSCTALINGGQRDKPMLGITLCVSYPEQCELELGA